MNDDLIMTIYAELFLRDKILKYQEEKAKAKEEMERQYANCDYNWDIHILG